MDIKLSHRDITLSSAGAPVMVDGMDELLQRVMIACTVMKGSFLYDRELGIDLNGVDFLSEGAKNAVALRMNEALVNIPDVKIEVEQISVDGGQATVRATLRYQKEEREFEVIMVG